MTLIPIMLVAVLAGWFVYRDYFFVGAKRRFVRIDYCAHSRHQRSRIR